MIMRYKLLLIAFVTFAFFASCDKHDSLDDGVIVGPMAPQIYWSVTSTTTKAGNDVGFTAQYYTSNEDAKIDHLEVWYNVVITENQQVTCPHLSSFSYSVTKSIEEEIRISQYISSYKHDEKYWNDTLRAYTFTDVFPTSYTLNSITWNEPEIFDSILFVTYFGENFAQDFKDSLFVRMKYVDYAKMMSALSLVEDFTIYKDSTYDANSDSWLSHFPLDTLTSNDFASKTPDRSWHKYDVLENGDVVIETIPTDVLILFDGITIDKLLLNSSKGNIYELQFTRSYYINANLRCIDTKGAIGTALETKIELN